MHKSFWIGALAAVCSAVPVCAQNEATPPAGDDIQALRQQVEALTETVKALQTQVEEQRREIHSRRSSAEERLAANPYKEAVAPAGRAGEAGEVGVAASSLDELRQEIDALKASSQQGRSSLLNPDVSTAIDFITSYSGAADNINFTLRDVELMIKANVDTYARAYVVLNASTELNPVEKTDIFGDTDVGLEEAAIVTTSLPWGLEAKGGEFFADFTRLGKVHPHERPFVDGPASVDGIIGGETKARGFEIDWVPPIPRYLRVTGGVVDNIGAEMPLTGSLVTLDDDVINAYADPSNRAFHSLMGYGRLATQFELGQNVLLHVGGDYAQSGHGMRRQIASGDMKLEWQPSPQKYDVFETGGEFLWTKQKGQLAGDLLFNGNSFASAEASGWYAYAQYRFGKAVQPGVRVDYIRGDSFEDLDGNGDPDAIGRFTNKVWSYSAYLTLYASEFQRFRLQLSYLNGSQDFVPGSNSDIQAFLQWSVILGPHKHDFSP